MALSLGVVILLGLTSNKIFARLRLPGLLGMLIAGILLGPYGINFISADIMRISADLRKIALVIILLRAGLGIDRGTLNKVGRAALRMSFLPGLLEGFAIALIAQRVFSMSFIESGMLGFIVAAVSPAVIVPQMLNFIDRRLGEEKGIPTLVLAGASIDDVFAITLFTTFLGLYMGSQINIAVRLLEIPLSIVIGVAVGAILGLLVVKVFRTFAIRNTEKALILIGIAILYTSAEDFLKGIVPIASLLGIMTVGFVILEQEPKIANQLADKFSKIWVFAELLLFVLIGAQVNVYVAAESGLPGLIIIAIGLVARALGVWLSLLGTNLNVKEKMFCVIAYTPKATVQAAIGAIPLAAGVTAGELILAIAVLSVIVTAPLGALGIKVTGERWLQPPAQRTG